MAKAYNIHSDLSGQDATVVVMEPEEWEALPENASLVRFEPMIFVAVAELTPRLEEVMLSKDLGKVVQYLYDKRPSVDIPERMRRVDYERSSVVQENPISQDIDACEASINRIARVSKEGEDGYSVGVVIEVSGKPFVADLDKNQTDSLIAGLIHHRNVLWPTP